MKSSIVDTQNRQTLEKVEELKLRDFKDIGPIRKQHPYRGFIDIPLPGGETISLFCNNDDLTALAYLWIDGFEEEPYSLRVWMELCRHARGILDIGSHVGLYGLAAARANPAAKITAFEAVDYIYARLMINITANGLQGRIKAHNFGVSDRQGWTVINLYLGPQMMSKGASIDDKPDKTATKKWLQTDTIDAVCADDQVDLIKIDVEGHEAMALAGAAQTLEATKPTVLCEILRRDVGEGEVFRIFERLGYDCYMIREEEERLEPVADYRTVNDSRGGEDRNFLFVHPDRKAQVSGLLDG